MQKQKKNFVFKAENKVNNFKTFLISVKHCSFGVSVAKLVMLKS